MLVAAVLVIATVGAAGVLASGAIASEEDADDDTRENARPIEMNSTINGTIDGPNDTDWYAVEAGDLKRLLVGLYAEESDRDGSYREVKQLSVTLYGPDGERLSNAGTETRSYSQERAGLNHAVESGDTYYVKVASEYDEPASNPDAEEATGSRDYELDVESVALDTNEPNDFYDQGEPGDHPENATDLSFGEQVSTNLVGTESDAYAVELEEGDTVNVTYEVTNYVNFHGPLNSRTVVLSPSGKRVASSEIRDDDSPDRVTYSYTANESGTYYVNVMGGTDGTAYSRVRGNFLTQYNLRVDLVCEP